MLPSTSFFKRTSVVEKKKTGAEKTVIDVGSEPFHALAVAFIDNLKNGVLLPEEKLKEVLGRFFAYFPDYKVSQVYISPMERMRLLINNPRKAEVVDCMAEVLWRLTKTELLNQAPAYPELFQGLAATVTDEELRQKLAQHPRCLLGAFAKVLDLQVQASFKEPQHELRRREVYGENAGFKLELQVQAGRCLPRVKNKEDFASVGQLALAATKPRLVQENEVLTNQLQQIEQADHALWQEYEYYLGVLNGLRLDGELDKAKAINLYIHFLPEQGEQERFADLERRYAKPKIAGDLSSCAEEELNLLLMALARGLSSAQINADKFFEGFTQSKKAGESNELEAKDSKSQSATAPFDKTMLVTAPHKQGAEDLSEFETAAPKFGKF